MGLGGLAIWTGDHTRHGRQNLVVTLSGAPARWMGGVEAPVEFACLMLWCRTPRRAAWWGGCWSIAAACVLMAIASA